MNFIEAMLYEFMDRLKSNKNEVCKIESIDCYGTYTCKIGLDRILITRKGLEHLLRNKEETK